MKISSTWISNLLMGAFAAFSTGGFASDSAPLTPEVLSQMSPRHRHEYIQQQIEKQNSMAAQATTLDTKPPVLTAFSAGATVDLAQPLVQLVVDITVKDNMSGFDYGFISARGPFGQLVQGTILPGYPPILYRQKVALPLTVFAEPGIWTITHVSVRDVAGNWMVVDSIALSKLGNIQFTVVNSIGGDQTPPILVSGKILSPTISLSTPPRGTTSGSPHIGAVLSVQDQGTNGSSVSGPRSVWVDYCLLADQKKCLTTSVGYYGNAAHGQKAVNLRPATEIYPGTPTGKYGIKSVDLYDHAGNGIYLLSKNFGGNTDFTKFFPSTTITVNP